MQTRRQTDTLHTDTHIHRYITCVCFLYVIHHSLFELCYNCYQVSVIKRLYAMKDAMQILEFDDPSSEALKAVLLQCYVTPIFLKADQVIVNYYSKNCYTQRITCFQGRKFLSSLFYLSLSYTAHIHESIKMLLLHCPSQHLTWYGNIYFDAWKNAVTPYLEVIMCYVCL